MAEYGIQMYSIRDITKDSMRMALEKVAEMGYKYVEFAGFFDYTPEQIKTWLDTFGLKCSGTHTGVALITPDKIDETIRYHKIIGCDNLIVPGCDWSTPEKTENLIKLFNETSRKLRENGIRFGYHNHSKEFFPTSDGIVFENEIIEKTDAELEIDTFWLFNAGIDVISYLEAHRDRIKVIHLKDGVPSAEDKKRYDDVHSNVIGLSLGSGKAPVAAVKEWAEKNGVIMVVESEGLDPTGLEEIKRCIDYLNTLG